MRGKNITRRRFSYFNYIPAVYYVMSLRDLKWNKIASDVFFSTAFIPILNFFHACRNDKHFITRMFYSLIRQVIKILLCNERKHTFFYVEKFSALNQSLFIYQPLEKNNQNSIIHFALVYIVFRFNATVIQQLCVLVLLLQTDLY